MRNPVLLRTACFTLAFAATVFLGLACSAGALRTTGDDTLSIQFDQNLFYDPLSDTASYRSLRLGSQSLSAWVVSIGDEISVNGSLLLTPPPASFRSFSVTVNLGPLDVADTIPGVVDFSLGGAPYVSVTVNDQEVYTSKAAGSSGSFDFDTVALFAGGEISGTFQGILGTGLGARTDDDFARVRGAFIFNIP